MTGLLDGMGQMHKLHSFLCFVSSAQTALGLEALTLTLIHACLLDLLAEVSFHGLLLSTP